MKPRGLSIHRIILIRLLPAWLILSVVMGGAAYWLESRRVDRYVYTLASEAAGHFDFASEHSFFEGNATDHLPALKAMLKSSSFVGMRLYDRNRKELTEVWGKADQGFAEAMQQHPHEFPRAGTHHHTTLRVNDHLSVWALVPLVDSGGGIYGYFEGVYVVPQQTMEAIRSRVSDTLFMVLIVTTLTTFALYPVIVSLNRDTVRLSKNLMESVVELMRVLGSAIAKRDSDTDSHNYRVALYSIHLAEALGRPPQEIAALIAGAFLHDVGKIGISDGILLKQGRLTQEEFETMKTHVAIGDEIVRESKWLVRAREVVASHHEKFDGSGYPKGLRGHEIPLNARLFTIADVFDALTSKRPYKEAMPLEKAMTILRLESGRHFDPEILAVFEDLAGPDLERYGEADTAVLKFSLSSSVENYFPV